MAFTARFAGYCDACEGGIKPGEQIRDATEAQRGSEPYEHVSCPPSAADLTSGERPCQRCRLVHNGECF